MYSSDPLVTPSPKGSTPTEQTGIYTMSHMGKVACEITDPDGNHFQVSFSDHKIVSLCCCAGLFFKVVSIGGMWEFGSMK